MGAKSSSSRGTDTNRQDHQSQIQTGKERNIVESRGMGLYAGMKEDESTVNHTATWLQPKKASANQNVTGVESDVFQYYSMRKKELGHGHYGVVRVARHRRDGKQYAVKSIPKQKVGRVDTLRREVEILKTVNHPNIIKLFEVYEDTQNLHLVTELCTGGELFDRIIAKGHYSEADASRLVKKIVSAVKHCHDLGICHRDLKPENFLFETPEEDAELKVIDFGLSRINADVASPEIMTTRVGTPYYIAPEVLGRHYDRSCDMWSLGVITYILLSGYPPFYGDNDPEIFAAIRSACYSFDSPEWLNVSNDAKDLIANLLKLDPKQRLTANETLAHRWLCGHADTQSSLLTKNLIRSLKRFTRNNKLKKVALGVIADQLTEIEIKELKTVFKELDRDGNGTISVEELSEAVRRLGHGMLEDEARSLLEGVDVDKDGKIDYQEFIAATMERNHLLKATHLQNAFNYFDTRRVGMITEDDLIEFMGSKEHAREVMNEVDTNKDGAISFEEFVVMMQAKGIGDSGSGTPIASKSPNKFNAAVAPGKDS